MIDRVLRDKLLDAYMGLIPLITLNLVWFVVSLPLVTLIPATGALLYATNALAHGKGANIQMFFEGFRRYFWKSWQWGLLNLLIGAVLGSNLLFYSTAGSDIAQIARIVVIVVTVLWIAVQMQVFSVLLEQEQPKFTLALRNGLVLFLKNPFYSFGAAILIIAIVLFSTLVLQPSWIFISASACAYIANLLTVNSISKANGKKDTPLTPDPSPTQAERREEQA